MHFRFSLTAGKGSLFYSILHIHPEEQWSILLQYDGISDSKIDLICYRGKTHVRVDRTSLFSSMDFAATGVFIMEIMAQNILDVIEQTSGSQSSWLNFYLMKRDRYLLQVLCAGENLLLNGLELGGNLTKVSTRYEIPVTYTKGKNDRTDDVIARLRNLITHLSLQSCQHVDTNGQQKLLPNSLESPSISDSVVDGEVINQATYKDFLVPTANTLLAKLFTTFSTTTDDKGLSLTVFTKAENDTTMLVALGLSSSSLSSTLRYKIPIKAKDQPSRVSCTVHPKKFVRSFERLFGLATYLGYRWNYSIVVTQNFVILSLFCEETQEFVRCAIERLYS
ncbi:Hypothetical protein GLP15_1054 [Giardia lamblia P15]|uniref:Uncharacterized protein n=1 Tax=Giardia intestinalis (strain P15) TaxID=658858 RepID=E1F2Y3_GIAIA|nr:Hypothetical protein GLP15_1054 [Giardia lamblia P15]